MQRAAASRASSRSAAAWACSTASRHAGTGAVCSARRDAVVPLRIRGQEQPPAALPMSLSLLSRRRPARTAAAAAVELTPAADEGGIAGTMQLGAMIVAWYLLNIYFNIYNKQVRPPGAAIAAPLHHHRLPARLRLARHLPHVGRQAPPRAQALRRAAGQDRAAGRRAHAGHGVHQHEPGQGGRLLHAHRQGLGALLHRPALRLLPRRGAVAAGAGLSRADRRRRRPGVAHRGLLQLGRILERHGVESAQPDQECAQQAAPRRRRGGVHGRHKPLLGDHRAVLPAVLPSHDLRRGGQILPSVPPEHRPEPAGAVREGSTGRPLLPWLPEAVVHDPGEGVARDPLRGQLRQACGGHRLLRPLLPDAHLPCQCIGDWCGAGGGLPVLQAQENKAKEFMMCFIFSCFKYRF